MELEINHISIPASVRIIEQGAFVCEFNSSLTQIPPSCFHEASVKSNNRVKYWNKHAFKYVHTAADFNCDLILQFVLPAGLVRIGADTFNKRYATLEVQSGTYSEQWAIENAYRYTTNEEDDLSWLYN